MNYVLLCAYQVKFAVHSFMKRDRPDNSNLIFPACEACYGLPPFTPAIFLANFDHATSPTFYFHFLEKV